MMKETKREREDSMILYILASFTKVLFFMSIFLVNTRDECRYKLCGIITAPTIPSAACNEPDGILGITVPKNIS